MRSKNVDFDKLALVQTLFWIQFAWELLQADLIISVDETTLNRDIYNSSGWGSKGILKETNAITICGGISIVSAIPSDLDTNGSYFMEF